MKVTATILTLLFAGSVPVTSICAQTGSALLSGPDGAEALLPDTNDHPTPPLWIRIEAGLVMWGAEEGNLYYSWNGRVWTRVTTIDGEIHRLFPVNDTTVGIWNGIKYHAYSIGADSAVPILPEGPLHEFLKYPIRTVGFVGAGMSVGWIHGVRGTRYPSYGIGFNVQNGVLVPSDEFTVPYEGDLPVLRVDDLAEALRVMSRDVDSLPDLKDFHITPEDIQLFHQRVDQTGNYYLDMFFRDDTLRFDPDFYHRIPELLDTLSPELFDSILTAPPRPQPLHPLSYAVTIINENNDTIGMLGQYRILMPPWGLPWRVETERDGFYTRSIDFARFIGRMLPANVTDKPMFSNVELMMRIGDYLYYGL